MGILGAKRVHWTPMPLIWTAANAEILVTAATDMEDDEVAGPRAYGARFTCPDAPAATMTIWAYPIPGGPGTDPGTIILGWRVHHRAGNWQAALYHSDVACGQWYDNLQAAEMDCIEEIAGMMRFGPDTPLIPDFMTRWEGRPW